MKKNEKTYDGQTASFLAAVATCMPKNLKGDTMQGWIDNPKTLQNFLAGLCLEEKKKEGVFDSLHAFREGQSGLWRSENFKNRILSVAGKIAPVQLPDHISGFDLPENMNDKEIRANLGDGHVFGTDEGCTVIVGMISRQPNAEAGDLLNNGCVNIFYIRGLNAEIFAVHVAWYADDRKWHVLALRLDVYRWSAGYRAFSRNSILAK